MKFPKADKKILKTPKSALKKRLKRVFSLYIRKRAGNKCELHEAARQRGVRVPFRCGGPMQACHIIRAGKAALEFDEKNVYCGCAAGNIWEKVNRDDWQRLWPKLWPERVEYLRTRERILVRRSREDLLGLLMYYEKESQ